MTTNNTNERLLRFLQATPEQQEIIDKILEGKFPAARRGPHRSLTPGYEQGSSVPRRFTGDSLANDSRWSAE